MLPNPIIAKKKVNVQFSGYITRPKYPNLRRKLWRQPCFERRRLESAEAPVRQKQRSGKENCRKAKYQSWNEGMETGWREDGSAEAERWRRH